MKKFIMLLPILIICINACSQQDSKQESFNLGFEKVLPGQKLPEGWFTWGSGYNIDIDTTITHVGKHSISIRPSADKTENAFGCIATRIPARYDAKEIELKAWIKLKDVKDGPIGLLLRIDGNSETLQFDNMQGRNIQGTSDWTLYSVKLPYPREARNIFIGALLSGSGQIWVDDFEVFLDGKDISQAPLQEAQIFKAEQDKEFLTGSKIQSIELDKQKIENLKVVGLVWGFLKYYHPGIAKGDFNWDFELFRVLPSILEAKSGLERDQLLGKWIEKLGPVKNSTEKEPTSEVKIHPDLDWITHLNLNAALVAQLQQIKNAKRENSHYYIDFVEKVGNPVFKNENGYTDMKYPDAGFRLLSLYRYWNIIQYYYPYKNLIEEDWKAVLEEFIPKFTGAANALEYRLAALELIARVHDTHANIWGMDEELEKYQGNRYTPYIISFIENKPVIIRNASKKPISDPELKPGDIITSVNGKPVDKIVSERLKYTPASNYPTQLRIISGNLLRTNDSLLNIKIIRKGVPETKTIKTYNANQLDLNIFNQKDTCFKILEPDIAYLYPGTIKNDYLPRIKDKIFKSKALIVDLRCYPSDFIVFSLGNLLMPKRTPFVKFTKSSFQYPGLFSTDVGIDVGEMNLSHYKGKVLILINEITQSQAEYTTMALRVAPDAKVIGSQTAGADGNVSQFYLPGGIYTLISGIGVYYPDGRETQRVGIVPDIEVKPSIQGILEGRDELMEKALQIIHQK